MRALDAAGVLVDNIEVRQPSLDDVFFSLTGGHIESDDDRTGTVTATATGPRAAGTASRLVVTLTLPRPTGDGDGHQRLEGARA